MARRQLDVTDMAELYVVRSTPCMYFLLLILFNFHFKLTLLQNEKLFLGIALFGKQLCPKY